MKNSASDKILNLVYVDKCALCRKACTDVLCQSCLSKLKVIGSFCCPKCGKPLGRCICKKLAPDFKRCVSAFRYEDAAVSALVLKFKATGVRKICDILAHFVADKIRSELSDINFDFVTYVPARRIDVKRKGFNHAQLLAKSVSKLLEVPLAKPPIKRKGYSKQKFQNAKDRSRSAAKNYVFKPSDALFGNVLLVDDVMTSGATLSACSKILRMAGAEEVYCATAATAVKNNKI